MRQERTKGERVGRIKRKGDNGGDGLLRQGGNGKIKIKLEQGGAPEQETCVKKRR